MSESIEMRFSVLEEPEAAVSLEDLKAHLNVDTDNADDNEMISALGLSAQAGFESCDTGILRRPVAYQKIEMEVQRCDSYPLTLFGPIDDEQPIEIVYVGEDGAEVAIDAASYRIDRLTTFSPRLTTLSTWPAREDIRIRAHVGLDADDPRIGNLQSAIKLAVEKIYDGAADKESLQSAIDLLIAPYRVISI